MSNQQLLNEIDKVSWRFIETMKDSITHSLASSQKTLAVDSTTMQKIIMVVNAAIEESYRLNHHSVSRQVEEVVDVQLKTAKPKR